MTIHYHGTPITPKALLSSLVGRCFCVSFASPSQTPVIHQIGQSVMHDNGAFSVWKKTSETISNWTSFYRWVEPLIENAIHWAVIPDEIDSGSQAQDYLISQWPFGHRGAPVWHMDEPVDRLFRLADAWPKICIGSTAEYKVVGSPSWHTRLDEAFEGLTQRHRFLPWVHMLRGMQTVKYGWRFPFSSVDSTDIAQNHHLRRHQLDSLLDELEPVSQMAERWDGYQCPDKWIRSIELDHDRYVKSGAQIIVGR